MSNEPIDKSGAGTPTIDDVEIPVLPLRNLVLFPGAVLSVEVGRRSSLRLLDEVSRHRPARLLVAVQKDPQTEEPEANDLHATVVEAEVLKLIRFGPDRVTAVLRGQQRRSMRVLHLEPYLTAKLLPFPEANLGVAESGTLAVSVREAAARLVELSPEVGRSLGTSLEQLAGQKTEPGTVADVIASHLDMPVAEQLAILFQPDVKVRLDLVLTQLKRQMEVIELKSRIDSQVQDEMSRQQREAVLRQRMKAIKEELGEDDGDSDLDQFDDRIKQAKMTEEAEKAARRQLSRLRGMPSGSAEYTVQRTYLEWLCDLPWSKRTEDRLDLQGARDVLEADHHGIAKVKKRILEYLAVRKLAPGKKGPILCLAGPPGVGKTSLGRSVAKALGREFIRISLGGVRDEAEIRGHRRTYIGALPGRFIQALKRAGTKNPVLLLDEIDKLGADHRGDPGSALLEVLDPEQNNSFSDHYMEVPFDLSEVIFIATANQLDTIPGPLLDRMELIELPGYTIMEKKAIAERHLVPKQLAEHGIKAEQVTISGEAILEVIEHYTREAGVRNLERELASIIRGLAMRIASNEPVSSQITRQDVGEFLGPHKHVSDVAEQTQQPGVATGLAWTPVGGDILFIEATAMSGKGQVVMTGQLGAVMKESAQAAMSWVKSHIEALALKPDLFEAVDVHLHVPQGGIRKDGPSAGTAILVAIVSLITGNRVRADVAMTGEITLRGAVLPVGGIKDKVLAAHRAGIKRVILPERNRKDLIEVPEEVRNELQFVFARHISTVLEHALDRPIHLLGRDGAVAKAQTAAKGVGQEPGGAPASSL